jgi:hypothetical protein
MKDRTTPTWVTGLNLNEILVVGTNRLGIHGAGAALMGRKVFGLMPGVGEGISGRCYALPTKRGPYEQASLSEVAYAVDRFTLYAATNPTKTFLVTEVGCKLAGFVPRQIAPLFAKASQLKNVHLPAIFWLWLEAHRAGTLTQDAVPQPIPVERGAGVGPPVGAAARDDVAVVVAQDRVAAQGDADHGRQRAEQHAEQVVLFGRRIPALAQQLDTD